MNLAEVLTLIEKNPKVRVECVSYPNVYFQHAGDGFHFVTAHSKKNNEALNLTKTLVDSYPEFFTDPLNPHKYSEYNPPIPFRDIKSGETFEYANTKYVKIPEVAVGRAILNAIRVENCNAVNFSNSTKVLK